MANCGDYELEAAIGWGRRATFFAARTSGAKGPALIVIRRARMVERTHRHAFLRAAAEQQAAVGAGCRRLAPILAFDCDESGFAFYATARYETSLAEFLEAGCKVDGALLREIVTGVLAALSELHEKSRRAHGNLTPGNILLDPQGRIFLTDLAPSAKDATTADDLFALGTLIYQLVRRTARIGALNPPLDYSPEWTESLGGDAEGWREFTNRVLTKSRNTKPDALKVAAGELKSLGRLAAKAAVAPMPVAPGEPKVEVRRAPPKKKSALPKVIALILLLAGGGGGTVWWKSKEAEKKRQIELALEKKLREERDGTLPEAIKTLRAELRQPLPTNITADKTLQSLLGRIGRSLDGTGNKNDVKSLLGNWELPDKMKTQAAAWRNAPREWTYLAGLLDAAAQIDAEGETSIIGQLDKAIAARSAADELDRLWGEVTLILGDLKATNNARLPDFTPWAVNEILFATRLADAPVRAQAALERLRDILTFQREKGPLVLWTRFEKEAPEVLRKPSSEAMPGWPAKWKQEVVRFTGPTDEKRAEWQKLLANAEGRILKRPAKEQPGWRNTLDAERTATADALESDVPAIDKRLLVFKGLRTPEEDDYEKYEPFLRQWKQTAAQALDKKDAQAALDAFKKGTDGIKVTARYQTDIAWNLMREALKTPDKISLLFSQPDGWELSFSDPGMAKYIYQKRIEVPFLALGKTGFAMAAIETPLALAKLAGGGGTPPGSGPKIRTTDFSAEQADSWLWKGPLDFMRGQGINSYFAPGVNAGDVGIETCPVTWLSFEEAKTLAKKLGGELPTAAQWSGALDRTGDTRRLRSKAWTAQVNQVTQWNTTYKLPTRAFLPDVGSFSKQLGLAGNNAYLSDIAEGPNAAGDASVWLKSAIPNGGWQPKDKFYNLIGNAAEWVSDNGSPAVIGGSIVSPPSLPNNTPLPIRTGAGAFDVTFRLVVKTGEGGEGIGLAKFKEAAAAIPVPAVPASQ